jgi:hypothetical protein
VQSPFDQLGKPSKSDEAQFCPEKGFYHPKLVDLPAHDAVVVDLPMDSKADREAFIRMVRELDVEASLDKEKLKKRAREWYGGVRNMNRCAFSPADLNEVPAQGLAGGHTLPELLEGCKLEGAQGLVALMPNPAHPSWHIPVAYLNYWTDVAAPHHMKGLMDLVRSQVGPEEKFALADTVVCLPMAPKGMYRVLLAHATLELYEKAVTRGITKVYDIVRLEPNPNTAAGAHETLGWRSIKDSEGRDLELFDTVVSEATQLVTPARFQVICLDLKSPEILDQIEAAKRVLSEKSILSVDLEGCPETYAELRRFVKTESSE